MSYNPQNPNGQATSANSSPVVVASDQSAVPVSAGSLPLPSGAATAAKQPALGTAGTASADVITVQGKSGMTAVVVDGSGVTQPVSASSLPLPTSAATSTKQSDGSQKSQIVDGSGNVIGSTTNALDVNIKSGGSSVTQYTEDAAAAADPVGGMLIARRKDTLSAAEVSADGDNIALNSTNKGQLHVKLADTVTVDASGTAVPITDNSGSLTVDQPTGTNLHTVVDSGTITTVTNVVHVDDNSSSLTVDGTVTANAGTNLNTSALALESGGNLATLAGTVTSAVQQGNVKQINGVTPLMGNGVTGTGSQRVTIASDNTPFPVKTDQTTHGTTDLVAADITKVAGGTAITSGVTGSQAVGGDTASGSSDAGNPNKIGGVGRTTNPTAVTDGQRVNAIFDKLGKQVVVGSVRDLKVQQATTITSSTAETTVLTSVASTFLDVYGVIVANTSATACDVTFKDATSGTTRFDIHTPAGDTRGFMLPESAAHNQASAANNWTATCSASVASIKITMLAVKNI